MDDIDVVGALSFLVPVFMGELVDNIGVVRVLSFLISVLRGAGGRN